MYKVLLILVDHNKIIITNDMGELNSFVCDFVM